MSKHDDDLDIPTIGKMSETEARMMLERIRWPDGQPVCPHCGTVGEATAMESSRSAKVKLREGVYNCRACRAPFTATVGTIFEGSHVPLSKWMLGFFIFASAKKSISALQLQRQLGIGSYRTAWHMAHRIRAAMANGGPQPPFSGDVEADETYVGGRPRNRLSAKTTEQRQAIHKAWRKKRTPVAVLVERDGRARARVIRDIDGKKLRAFVMENVDVANSRLLTDELKAYRTIGKAFAHGHGHVNHSEGEYARGDVHSNTAESFHSLFKRAYHGSWHHVSREHMTRYLAEQCFRWSHKTASDTDRTVLAIEQATGVRLYYKKPRGRQGLAGEGLVAS